MSKESPENVTSNLLALFASSTQMTPQTILELNSYTQKFGVTLMKEESLYLLEARRNTLITQERIEFSEGILPKLIFAFCDSPYIYQDNYLDTLERLQEIFYHYKNECLDELTDDELIEKMKLDFDVICEGSLDYLEDTCLESFSREIREGTRKFIGLYEEDEDEY